MTMNINNFLSNMDSYGKASPNKFEVTISIPPMMNQMIDQGNLNIPIINFMNDTSINFIKYRAEAINIPGIDILAVDSNYMGIGPKIKQAYNVVLSDVVITFINDSQGILEEYFHLWFNLIYNFGEDSLGNTTAPTYLSNYRSDVCASITIYKYDDLGNLLNTYSIINALPTLITPMEYSWENRNNVSRLRVKFDYTNFSIN